MIPSSARGTDSVYGCAFDVLTFAAVHAEVDYRDDESRRLHGDLLAAVDALLVRQGLLDARAALGAEADAIMEDVGRGLGQD